MPDIDAMKSEYKAGATIYEIGARRGICGPYVSRLLRKAGTQMRPRGSSPKSKERGETIARMKAAGLMNKQIAIDLGLTPGAISNRLVRARRASADQQERC